MRAAGIISLVVFIGGTISPWLHLTVSAASGVANILGTGQAVDESSINTGNVVGQLVSDVIQQSLQSCTAIIIYSEKHIQSRSSRNVHDVLLWLLRQGDVSWVVYKAEEVREVKVPSAATVRRPTMKSSGVCIVYVLLMPLDEAAKLFRFISRSDWFPGSARYFLLYGGIAVTPKQVMNDPILVDAYNTLYISYVPQSNFFNLYANCPFCQAGSPEVVMRNVWDPTMGMHLPNATLFPDLFLNCNGHVFRAVSLEFSPFMVYKKEEGADPLAAVTKVDCLDVRIMGSIASLHNFTYEVYEPLDMQWGYQMPNGSWSGVIGTVERYEADFSMDVAVTAQRDEAVDFTLGYHIEPLTFVISKPMPLPQWLSLIRPFQIIVWITLLGAMILSGLAFWAFNVASTAIQGGKEEGRPDEVTLLLSYFIMLGTLFTQGQKWPQIAAVRCFSGFWILFSFVMTISYICNLTAFMTVPALSPTLETLEELTKSDFKWGIADYGAADYQMFKTSKVPIYKEIFRGLDFCPSLLGCLRRTQREQYAYISWRTYMRDAIALELTDIHGDSNIHLARTDFFPSEFGFALQKGSPLKRTYDVVIQRLLEAGLVRKWLTGFIEAHSQDGRRKAVKQAQEDGSIHLTSDGSLTLTLHHLQGVFLVYSLCILLASLVFMVEVFLKRVAR